MIRHRAVTDTKNPPGQVKYIPGPDTIKHNVEEWKKLEAQRNGCVLNKGECPHYATLDFCRCFVEGREMKTEIK